MAARAFEPFGIWEWARKEPNRLAVIEGDRQTTFGELAARTNQLARAFRKMGIGFESAVAVVIKNQTAFYEIDLALGQIGAYLVVINWHLTLEEKQYILDNSEAQVIIADSEFAQELSAEPEKLPAQLFTTDGAVSGWGSYSDLGADEDSSDVPDRLNGALMLFTSGTTGRPKGVRRKLVAANPEDAQLAIAGLFIAIGLSNPDGRHLVSSPLYHGGPAGWSVAALHFGETIILQPRFDPEEVLAAIEKYRVTSSHMVPTQFHRLLRLPQEVRDAADLSSLEFIVHAGAPCPPQIKNEIFEWFGPIIWEYMAATEGIVSVSSPQHWIDRPGTVGKALSPKDIRVMREDGTEAAPGEEGIFYFRPFQDYEYHNDPEKTAADRDGEFATVGDIGLIDEDGYVFILDRRVDLIISGGVNIYPAEIEAAMITHPSVADVGVIGLEDEEWGKRVAAVVQVIPGAEANDDLIAELREYAKVALPSYKRPREYFFLEEFPRMESGKLRRRDLRDIFAAK